MRLPIETLLNQLGGEWERKELLASGDDPEIAADTPGVVYIVQNGPASGSWIAWGETAEVEIFNRIVSHLDEQWRGYLKLCDDIGAALRSVGR